MTAIYERMFVVPPTQAEVDEDEELYGDGLLVSDDDRQRMRRERRAGVARPRVALVEWPTGDRESDEPHTHVVVDWQQREGVEALVGKLNAA